MSSASWFTSSRRMLRSERRLLLRALLFGLLWQGAVTFQPPAAGTLPLRTILRASRLEEGDEEAFTRITLARKATKHFEPKPVPEDTLKQVPSGDLIKCQRQQAASSASKAQRL